MTKLLEKIYLKDYTPLPFKVDAIDLYFDIHDDIIDVTAQFDVKRFSSDQSPLVLWGATSLELISVAVDGVTLSQPKRENETLEIEVGDQASLVIKTRIYPKKNLALEGIYSSGSILCSQNEPEGFRHITFFLDRPDNLSIYTTTIEGDSNHYPYLLSNGNLMSKTSLDNGRLQVKWHDPYPKPTYLFAFVAGDFGCVEDEFETRSGRKVAIQFFVDHGNESKCSHAISSLKRSMKWDEDVFNLEYDLDIYMVVAVDAFNFGAMENKGLNIFNSKYVLADPKTATDVDYINIENVIGHEYFHNWTGNRITCRDWFQLTLKEGLTVFRDQEFTGDMTSRGVKRVQDVNGLKTVQFLEDSGPNAHPIRPESYTEINNFYTSTVYRKGAEVIRMIHTILGRETFMKGIARYISSFDGQAVTTDDFLGTMDAVSDFDFTVFKRWYSQSGTPRLIITSEYNNDKRCRVFTIKQEYRLTQQMNNNLPFCIPLTYTMISAKGENEPKLLIVDQETMSLEVSAENDDIPVWLHDFSAPIHLSYNYSLSEITRIITTSSNLFSRVNMMQKLMMHTIQKCLDPSYRVSESDVSVFCVLWNDSRLTDYEKAEFFTIPSLAFISEELKNYEFSLLEEARDRYVRSIAVAMHPQFMSFISESDSVITSFSSEIEAIGTRHLYSVVLVFLGTLPELYAETIFGLFKQTSIMTINMAALKALSLKENAYYATSLDMFYDEWKHEFLVMNKWFTNQALSPSSNCLEVVKRLKENPSFDKRNPNMLRSLLYAFTMNLPRFHTKEGYSYIAEQIIEIDAFNPSMASFLMEAYSLYKKLPVPLQGHMKSVLEELQTHPLSKNTAEILENILNR